MMKRKEKLLVVCLFALLALFAGCEKAPIDQIVEEKTEEAVKAEEARGTVTVSLSASSSRTILPSTFVAPDYYRITLTPQGMEGVNPISKVTEDASASVTFTGLKLGKWTARVEGFVKAKEKAADVITDMKTMEGTTAEAVDVTANGPNTITVQLEAVETGKGSMEVKFTWTDEVETAAGPFKDMAKKDDFKLNVYSYPGNKSVGSYDYKFSTLADNSFTLRLDDLDSTTNGLYRFEIVDKDLNLVYSTAPIAFHIYPGQLSVPDAGSASSFNLTKAPLYAAGIGVQGKAWSVKSDTEVNLFLNLRKGTDRVDAYVYMAGTDQLKKKQSFEINTLFDPIVINGLAAGEVYDIKLQAHYSNKLMSPVAEFPSLKNVESLIAVKNLTIENAPTYAVELGSEFTLRPVIEPLEPTYPETEWTFADGAFINSGNTFTANKLGSFAITLNSLQPVGVQKSAVTDPIKVVLAHPASITATAVASGINVEYEAVPEAESYTLERKTAGTEEWSVVSTSASLSFLDKDVVSGESYDYRVKATTTAVPGSDSYYMPTSESITAAVTTVEITLPSVEGKNAIAFVGETKSISIDQPLQFTVNLDKTPLAGFTFEWYLHDADHQEPKKLKTTTAEELDQIVTFNFTDLIDKDAIAVDHTIQLRATKGNTVYSGEFQFSHVATVVTITSNGKTRIPVGGSGSDFRVTATTDAPTPDLTFQSTNPAVLQVSPEGVITALTTGEANLVVSDIYGSATAIHYVVYTDAYKTSQDLIETVNAAMKAGLRKENAHTIDWYTWFNLDIHGSTEQLKFAGHGTNDNQWGFIRFTDYPVGNLTISGTLSIDHYENGTAAGVGGDDLLGWIGPDKRNQPDNITVYDGNTAIAVIHYDNINVAAPTDPNALYTITFKDNYGTLTDGTYSIEKDKAYYYYNESGKNKIKLNNRLDIYNP